MARKLIAMRDLERIVLAALQQQASSAHVVSVIVEPSRGQGDWTLGPVGFSGDAPPKGVDAIVARLQQEYALAAGNRVAVNPKRGMASEGIASSEWKLAAEER